MLWVIFTTSDALVSSCIRTVSIAQQFRRISLAWLNRRDKVQMSADWEGVDTGFDGCGPPGLAHGAAAREYIQRREARNVLVLASTTI